MIVNQGKNKVTPAEISRQLLKDPHSISQLLVRMEKRGLVKNIKGLPRKNMIRVKLTSKGQKAFKNSLESNNLGKIFSILSEDEKEQFHLYCEKIREMAMSVLPK